jgi:hypothetical protein
MTDSAGHDVTAPVRWRRTMVLLVAWIAAGIVASTPGDSSGAARAQERSAQVPVVVNTGPECFAGHGAAPPRTKNREKHRR